MNLLRLGATSGRADHSPIPKRIVITKMDNHPDCQPRTLKPKSRTQPIPIKHSEATESDYTESDEAVDRAHYDLATWNMYMLITNARRLRAANQGLDESSTSASSTEVSVEDQLPAPRVYRDQECIEPRSTDLDESSYDDCYEGIFDLDTD